MAISVDNDTARPSHLLRGFDRCVERRRSIGARFNRGQTRRDQGERDGTKEKDREDNRQGKGERQRKREREKSLKILFIAPNGRSRAHV